MFTLPEQQNDLLILRSISPPPRDVPLSVRLDLRFCPPNLMSVGKGWFLGVMGFAFALIVSSATELDDLVPRNWDDIGNGKITKIEGTDARVGGEGCGSRPVFAYHFEIVTPDEAENITGISYGFRGIHAIGDEVVIQRAGKRYRVQDLHLTPGDWGWLPLIFLGCCLFGVIGLYSPIKGLFVGGKAIWLLQYGHAVIARYSGMEPTGMSIHRRGSERDTLIMNVNFEYQVSGNNYVASVQALETDTFRWTETKTKFVFYDPMRPDKSVVLDGVPGGIQIDELTGRFKTNPLNYALQSLAAVVVFGQVVAIAVLVIRAI